MTDGDPSPLTLSQMLDETEADGDVVLVNSNDVEEDEPQIKKPRKIRSPIYQYFHWIPSRKKYKCKYCPAEYTEQKDGSTGTMTNHIKKKHRSMMDGQSSVQEATLHNIIEKTKPVRKFSSEGFREMLVKFIIECDLPFLITEKESFQELLKYSLQEKDKTVQIPGRDTIKREISNMYTSEKQALIQELQKTPGKISFSVDCWTSSNQQPFQGIVGQWIDASWKLRTKVIDLSLLSGSHSGANLASSFFDALRELKCLQKVLAIATDNAKNMDTFFVHFANMLQNIDIEFDKENQRVRCLAHIINLACKEVIESATGDLNSGNEDDVNEEDEDDERDTTLGLSAVAKLRKGVVKIRSSPQRREKFKKHCAVNSLEPKELIRDVKTRWNSTYEMMDRALYFKDAIDGTLQSEPNLRSLVLENDEWETIRRLTLMLEPFKRVTLQLSTQNSPTVSRCALVYQLLFDHLEKFIIDPVNNLKGIDPVTKVNYPDWMSRSANAGWTKLKKYYPSSDGLVYVVATVLDPRCKLEWYKNAGWRKEWVDNSRKAVTCEWNQHYKNRIKPSETTNTDFAGTSGSGSTSRENISAEDLFETQMKKSNTSRGLKDELQQYLFEKVVDPKKLKLSQKGALGWWQNHEDEYPNLSAMARDYLAVPGTGVPCERLFSTGSDLLSSRRQSLSGETIQMCLCLKGWLRSKRQVDLQSGISETISQKMLGE